MGELENKVAFITGGARGMGALIAKKFAEEGAKVVISDIASVVETVPYPLSSSKQLDLTVSEIQKNGGEAYGVVADVRKPEQVENAVNEAILQFGKIDILVTSAGVLGYGYMWELTEQQWDDMMDINVKGTWLTYKYSVPHMISNKSGKIISISSVNGLRGGTQVGHYVASKHAVLGLVKSLAMEVGPHNINVNAICPTAVNTDMANNQATYDRLAAKVGATREEATPAFGNHHVFTDQDFISGEDVANTALFLASDKSRNITGGYIGVDAGYLTM